MLKIDKWITFCSDLIPAVMDDSKTLTSRVINGRGNEWRGDRLLCDWPLSSPPYQWDGTDTAFGGVPWRWQGKKPPAIGDWCWEVQTDVDDSATYHIRCPYGTVGTILGVKEGYQVHNTTRATRFVSGVYAADNAPFRVNLTPDEWDKWTARKFPYRRTPGRFMYKSLCRARLRVTSVRVERLQDIDEVGALAEGVALSDPRRSGLWRDYYEAEGQEHYSAGYTCPILSFRSLWDMINEKRGHGWDVNDWVWRVGFERIQE